MRGGAGLLGTVCKDTAGVGQQLAGSGNEGGRQEFRQLPKMGDK